MERKINKKIEEAFTNYKQDIKTGIVGVITAINCHIDVEYVSDVTIKETVKTELMNLLQELYDHPVLKLDKTDFQKEKE